MSTTCRSCGAPIIWCLTRNGKRMPVDANPDPDGNIAIVARVGNAPPAIEILNTRRSESFDAGEPHFATCPNSATHRKQ